MPIIERDATIGALAPDRCPICKTVLDYKSLETQRDQWNAYQDHLRTVHPSYVAWSKKNARITTFALLIGIAIIITLIFLANASKNSTPIIVLGIAIFLVIIAIAAVYNLVKIRSFRNEWKEQGTSR
jgi:fatty acid desaturase